MRDNLEIVLRQAQDRLDWLKKQIEALEELKQEKAQLERLCKVTTELLTGTAAPEASQWKPVTEQGKAKDEFDPIQRVSQLDFADKFARNLAPDDDRLWKAIQIVMSLAMTPMTAGEVLAALEEQKVEVNGVYKRETVRGALKRKPNKFERVGRGLFALREWPPVVKYSRGEVSEEESPNALDNVATESN